MGVVDRFLAFVEVRRGSTIVAAVSLTVAIAVSDWWIGPNVSLGFLYIFPILLAGAHLSRAQIAASALVMSFLREAFSPFRFEPAYPQRLAVLWFVFTSAGILIAEMVRNRRLTKQQLTEREQHLAYLEQAGRRLRAIVETSPMAIVTFDRTGKILLANESARSLLGIDSCDAPDSILRYIDALAVWVEKAQEDWRADFECRGRKGDDSLFLAHVWLSAYAGDAGLELAAVVWDASDELRGRETATMDSMAATSRVLLGAVSHEVRNLASAAAALHGAVKRRYRVNEDRDWQTLGSVLDALGGLASSGLRTATSRASHAVDLGAVLDEFRIIITPLLEDAGVDLVWEVPENVPPAAADHSGLLQVLLNLANNSLRALRDVERRVFSVQFQDTDDSLKLRISDTGHGVREPENLFRPFTSGNSGTGLGLYVSRAIVRSFGGNLRFESQQDGACFLVELRRPGIVPSTMAGCSAALASVFIPL